MLTVEAVNCPKCGAPIELERGQPITICLYCESRVVVMFGQNQRASAQLDQRPVDNEIRRQLIASLTSQHQRLSKEAAGLRDQADAVIRQVREEQEAERAKDVPQAKILAPIVVTMVLFAGGLCLSLTGNAGSWAIIVPGLLFVGSIFYMFISGFSAMGSNKAADRANEYILKRDRALTPINEKLNVVQYRMSLIEKQLKKLQS